MVAHDQSQSPLFSLPQEVRDNIWSYLIAFRYEDFELTTRPDYVFLEHVHTKPLPPAMLACKRAYHELNPTVQHTAALRACMFEFGKRVGFAVHGTLKVERLRKLYLVVAMEHANWNSWLRFLQEVLVRADSLRELVIDWEPRLAVGTGRGFLAAHERRMEESFLQVVAGLKQLDVIRIHGSVANAWKLKLKGLADVRVIANPIRWWREEWKSVDRNWVRKPVYQDGIMFRI